MTEYNLNGLGKFYDGKLAWIIPRHAILLFVSCWVFNCIIYWATQTIMENSYHYNLGIWIDDKIEFNQWWMIIYVGAYFFWIFNYAMISRGESKENWTKFATADLLSRAVCGVIFILLPTTLVRPDPEQGITLYWLVSLIYAADKPFNLFPSLHCLVSWMCYIGMRGKKQYPMWYKFASIIMAFLVFASTLYVKQHTFVDIIGGVVIAEICYAIGRKTNLYIYVGRFFDYLTAKCFGEKKIEEKKVVE